MKDVNYMYAVLCVIVIIGSFISPALVAFVNNRHQERLRMLDIKDRDLQHAHDFVDAYLMAAGDCIYNGDIDAVSEFGKHCGVVFCYIPSEFHDYVSAINSSALNRNKDHDLHERLETLAVKYSEKCGYKQK